MDNNIGDVIDRVFVIWTHAGIFTTDLAGCKLKLIWPQKWCYSQLYSVLIEKTYVF